MAELKETLYGYLDGNLRQMILSGVKNKDGASKMYKNHWTERISQ